MSPELVDGLEYSYPSDIWSIGVILYCMFAKSQKTVNFRSKMQNHFISKVLDKQKYQFKKEIIELIEKCLEIDPKKRPTAIVILEKLKFFKENLKEIENNIPIELENEKSNFIEGVKIITSLEQEDF